MTTKKPTAANNDVDALAPDPTEITLLSGSVVRVQPLRSRELLKLLKVLSRGAIDYIGNIDFDLASRNPQAFGQQMMALLAVAIPEAENEVMEFIQAIVRPDGFKERPTSKGEVALNEDLLTSLFIELDNPELEDLVLILTKVFEIESPNLVALGKKVAAMLKLSPAAKTPTTSS